MCSLFHLFTDSLIYISVWCDKNLVINVFWFSDKSDFRLFLEKFSHLHHSNYPFSGNSGIDFEGLAVPVLSAAESKIPCVWPCQCVNVAPHSFKDSRTFNKLQIWDPNLGVAQAFCDPQRRPIRARLKQILTLKETEKRKFDFCLRSL